MDINEVVNLITNNAFSIVMCGLLFWKMDKQDKDHKEETQHLTDALANNTLALQKLADKMDS